MNTATSSQPGADKPHLAAAVKLANTLDEWKDAGGDSLDVVRALASFIAAVVAPPASSTDPNR